MNFPEFEIIYCDVIFIRSFIRSLHSYPVRLGFFLYFLMCSAGSQIFPSFQKLISSKLSLSPNCLPYKIDYKQRPNQYRAKIRCVCLFFCVCFLPPEFWDVQFVYLLLVAKIFVKTCSSLDGRFVSSFRCSGFFK